MAKCAITPASKDTDKLVIQCSELTAGDGLFLKTEGDPPTVENVKELSTCTEGLGAGGATLAPCDVATNPLALGGVNIEFTLTPSDKVRDVYSLVSGGTGSKTLLTIDAKKKEEGAWDFLDVELMIGGNSGFHSGTIGVDQAGLEDLYEEAGFVDPRSIPQYNRAGYNLAGGIMFHAPDSHEITGKGWADFLIRMVSVGVRGMLMVRNYELANAIAGKTSKATENISALEGVFRLRVPYFALQFAYSKVGSSDITAEALNDQSMGLLSNLPASDLDTGNRYSRVFGFDPGDDNKGDVEKLSGEAVFTFPLSKDLGVDLLVIAGLTVINYDEAGGASPYAIKGVNMLAADELHAVTMPNGVTFVGMAGVQYSPKF